MKNCHYFIALPVVHSYFRINLFCLLAESALTHVRCQSGNLHLNEIDSIYFHVPAFKFVQLFLTPKFFSICQICLTFQLIFEFVQMNSVFNSQMHLGDLNKFASQWNWLESNCPNGIHMARIFGNLIFVILALIADCIADAQFDHLCHRFCGFTGKRQRMKNWSSVNKICWVSLSISKNAKILISGRKNPHIT